MPQYIIYLGGDSKYYYRRRVEGAGVAGTNLTSPTETLNGPYNTYALCQTAFQAQVFTDCNYSEVAF